MNIDIHMTFETLSFFFELAKGILKDYRMFIWNSRVLQVLQPRRRTTTLNKESSGEGIKEQTQGQVILL